MLMLFVQMNICNVVFVAKKDYSQYKNSSVLFRMHNTLFVPPPQDGPPPRGLAAGVHTSVPQRSLRSGRRCAVRGAGGGQPPSYGGVAAQRATSAPRGEVPGGRGCVYWAYIEECAEI